MTARVGDKVSPGCWEAAPEGGSCRSRARPLPPPDREEGKWSLITNTLFFSRTVSEFFPPGLFIGSQGYINALEI